jgi:hypothetical protein
MDDQQQYYKDAVTLVLELLQNTLGDQITTYYEGAPQEMPGEGAFPILAVYKTTGDITVGATTGDDVIEDIMIVVMTNRLIYAGAPNTTVDTPMRHLQRLVEGRDPTAPAYYGRYLPKTVIGALRQNLTLGTYSIDTDVHVAYDSIPRGKELAIAECDIKLKLTEAVQVLNRS